MLRHRLIFGTAMILGLLLVLYLDAKLDTIKLTGTFWQQLFANREHPPAGLVLLLMFLVVIPLGARELCLIFTAKGIHANYLMVTLSGIAGVLAMYMVPHTIDASKAVAIFATVVVAVFVATLIQYSYPGRTQGVVAAAGVTLFAMIYMGLLPGFYIAIRRWHTAWVIAAVILVTKSCDIGAYFTGRFFGKHKLIPWLSPKKTIEGLAGGVVISALTAVGLAALFNATGEAGHFEQHRVFVPTHYPLHLAALVGAALGLIGHFGDLVASLFKRDAGIKDSGSSIPGFGGILDVVDSPLIVAPFAYWILELTRPS